MCAEMRSPLQSRADDRVERVGTRPRCNWEPPERWWVTAEADPAPDGIECARHNRCQAQSTRKHQTVAQYRHSMTPRRHKGEEHKRKASRASEPTIIDSAHAAHATTANWIDSRPQATATSQKREAQRADTRTMVAKQHAVLVQHGGCSGRGLGEPRRLMGGRASQSSLHLGGVVRQKEEF